MPAPVQVSIYLHQRASLGFALLLDLVFRAANRLAGEERFRPSFVGDHAGPLSFQGGFRLARVARRLPDSGYLLIPPLEAFEGDFRVSERESAFVTRAHDQGLTLATACLGSFLPAAAGLLDGLEATTHWRWGDYARTRFPQVRWNPRKLVCEDPGFLTAGGLFAAVDLALRLVSRHATRRFCRDLGRQLLADSARQHQALYAATLTLEPRDRQQFKELERDLEGRLEHPPSLPEMARRCGMSLRSFQRSFRENYGLPPGKFLQLKRLEKAKTLLADERLSIDQVAVRCGFTQAAFFRLLFTRETGLSPLQYRRLL